MPKRRVLSGVIMVLGLVIGFMSCSYATSEAQSNVHEIYAVAFGTALAIFFYILARAIENFGGAEGD